MSDLDSSQTMAIQTAVAARQVAAGTTLARLVAALRHAPQAVSTAVNAEFVARAARQNRVLQAGDQVLLFQPIVGG